MARDISRRLEQLQRRRRGTDRLQRLDESEQLSLLLKSVKTEDWQKRAKTQSYTRYALGAMEAVDSEFTRISIETAERVGKQLRSALTASGFSVDFRLQGSVPLDVHIRGVSDVDLLCLEANFLTYDRTGVSADRYLPTHKTALGVLAAIREVAEETLRTSFPAAKVDATGSKAIMISGGSLARPVDVVPSHWFDTFAYQASGLEHDRAVSILDTKTQSTIDNWPFLHIKRVHERDSKVFGALKKAIRLCKHVKNDAEGEGTEINLPSFDIAATMYHADISGLTLGCTYELAILAETQRHLDYLTTHETEAQQLVVPDGSRNIFNSRAKLNGLRHLSIEMDDLLREVSKEQNYLLALMDVPSLQASRDAVSKVYVAAAGV